MAGSRCSRTAFTTAFVTCASMSATKRTPAVRWMIRVVPMPPKKSMIARAAPRSGRVWGRPVITSMRKVAIDPKCSRRSVTLKRVTVWGLGMRLPRSRARSRRMPAVRITRAPSRRWSIRWKMMFRNSPVSMKGMRK